jgi:hypothetical protein
MSALRALGYRPMNTDGERTYDRSANPTANEHPTNRVTVADAARRLGLSAEAVRMRVKRGTLASEKIDGTVHVILDADPTQPNTDQTQGQTNGLTSDQTNLVETLHSEVEFLREELKRREEVHVEESRRKDTIIAQMNQTLAHMAQRIPELEPAREATPEPRESPVSDDGAPYGTSSQEAEESLHRRSWWQRWFGG